MGGGFCGLWTALIAKEREPERSVTLIDGVQVGWAASGRNGGFADASLTHGEENGELHFADDMPLIRRLEKENFAAFRDTIARYDIDAEWEETGTLAVATEPHQIPWLRRRPAVVRDRSSSRGRRCASAAARRCTGGVCSPRKARRTCTRRSSLGVSRRLRSASGCGSSSGPARRVCGRHPLGEWRCRRRAGPSARAASRWPRTCSRRCCRPCGCSRFRCTTTC